MSNSAYELVRLRNGAVSIHSFAEGETMHPAIGPVAEAEQLYVNQLRLKERLAAHASEFVVWDVGLGAAANSIALLRAVRAVAGAPVSEPARAKSLSTPAGTEAAAPSGRSLRLLSFDHTLELLRFGLQHSSELGYPGGYERVLQRLLEHGEATLLENELPVNWRIHIGDFPALLARSSRNQEEPPHVGGCAVELTAPHAILFDPYSPAKNPAMWTAPLFADLFRVLDPARPCSLATYSRSTMIRVALLLAGFFVGAGHATGEKEETTIAANTLDLLTEPLDRRWLERARRSDAAEPLWEPRYERTKLSETTWAQLRQHPQFASLWK